MATVAVVSLLSLYVTKAIVLPFQKPTSAVCVPPFLVDCASL